LEEFIKVVTTQKDEIPILICYKNTTDKKIPIILLHQLLEDKESELMLSYYLAKQNYFVVAPDLLFHGTSSNSVRSKRSFDFNKLFSELDKSMELIKCLVDFIKFDFSSYAEVEKLGIIGSSYGGMLALTAGYRIPEIKFVASLCSAADWQTLVDNKSFEAFRIFSEQRPVVNCEMVKEYILQYDPIHHIAEYKDKPILLMNGSLDTTFTFKLIEPFYQKLVVHYEGIQCLERLEWKKYLKSGHKINYEMINDLTNWLNNLFERK